MFSDLHKFASTQLFSAPADTAFQTQQLGEFGLSSHKLDHFYYDKGDNNAGEGLWMVSSKKTE